MTGQRKQENKNIRPEIGTQSDVNKMSETDKIRALTGKQKVLDPSHYQAMPEYKDKTLFYCSDENGEVDRMLSAGAKPVPRRSKSTQVYKGINDQVSNDYEFKVVDKDKAGNPIRNYLLFMNKDEYYRCRIKPNEDRNEAIMKTMKMGQLNSSEKVMPGVTGLRTYAPKTTEGGDNGLEITHEV